MSVLDADHIAGCGRAAGVAAALASWVWLRETRTRRSTRGEDRVVELVASLAGLAERM
jgi:hypothetical protein